MTAPTITFLDWFAARLRRAGLSRAFGVPGGGASLDLMEALHRHDVDTVITAREDAAVMMAGVSGVLTQGPGLAFTTKGPGLANAVNGLASAALDRMPALLIAESFTEGELKFLSHQVYPQSELVAPLLRQGQGAELPSDRDAVEGWLNSSGSAPAAMFVSASDFNRKMSNDWQPTERSEAATPDLEQAQSLLRDSSRPVVIMGLEAANSSLTSCLRAFADKLAAPILCTYMAKGCVPDDDPHYAGIFTGGALEKAAMEAADLIVLVGLEPVELLRKPWTFSAPVLDLAERAYEPHYMTPAGRVIAPLQETLAALVDRIDGSGWDQAKIAKLRDGFLRGMESSDSGGLSSTAVVKVTRDAFFAHPRLCVDAGAHMFSACAFWPGKAPRDLLISNGLASMGFSRCRRPLPPPYMSLNAGPSP